MGNGKMSMKYRIYETRTKVLVCELEIHGNILEVEEIAVELQNTLKIAVPNLQVRKLDGMFRSEYTFVSINTTRITGIYLFSQLDRANPPNYYA